MPEILPLTVEEKKWLKKLQKVLDECPSNRMEAFTIGDNYITIYDILANSSEEIMKDNYDWCNVIEDTKTKLAVINFPFAVLSTAG